MDILMYKKALSFISKLYSDREAVKYYGAHPMKPKLPKRKPVVYPFPRVAPETVGVNSAHLHAFLRELSEMTELAPHLLMITKDDAMILECEFYPYRLDTWHVGHSLCKSITALAVGLLIEDGKLSLDEKITDIFAKRAFSFDFVRQKDITVRHLLNMSAGVSFNELGSVTYEDWIEGYFSAGVKFAPGSKFFYNSMNSYMLSAIIKEKTGRDMFDLLYERIFVPMGITEVYWETCPKGISKGGWGLYMKLEDMMKFGTLFLAGGMWRGKRLISAKWLDEMTKKQMETSPAMNEHGYGYQIWRSVREDSYQFNGMLGQNLIVFPDIRMTIGIYSASAEFFPKSKLMVLIEKYFGKRFQPGDAPIRSARRAYSELITFSASLGLPKPQKRQEKLQKYGELMPLIGKKYMIDGKNASLLPMTLSLLHANFSAGMESISFRSRGELIETVFACAAETIIVPFHFDGSAYYFDLADNGERFSCAAVGKMTKNEDDIPVFKLSVYFLETTAVRHIKIFFHRTKTVVCFSEEPTGAVMLEEFFPVIEEFLADNKALKSLLSKSDNNMVYELADRLFAPKFTVK